MCNVTHKRPGPLKTLLITRLCLAQLTISFTKAPTYITQLELVVQRGCGPKMGRIATTTTTTIIIKSR
jgi:hypothetical protein